MYNALVLLGQSGVGKDAIANTLVIKLFEHSLSVNTVC